MSPNGAVWPVVAIIHLHFVPGMQELSDGPTHAEIRQFASQSKDGGQLKTEFLTVGESGRQSPECIESAGERASLRSADSARACESPKSSRRLILLRRSGGYGDGGSSRCFTTACCRSAVGRGSNPPQTLQKEGFHRLRNALEGN
jgi:hypothetical protein